jgi:hypothetical protein
VNNEVYGFRKNSGDNTFVPWGPDVVSFKLVEFFTDELRKVMEFGDNRPSSVKVPDARTFESKRILHDGQFYRVSATIDFELNENYDPTAQVDFQNDLSAGNMPVYDTKPWWIKYLAIIGGALENMWERLF